MIGTIDRRNLVLYSAHHSMDHSDEQMLVIGPEIYNHETFRIELWCGPADEPYQSSCQLLFHLGKIIASIEEGYEQGNSCNFHTRVTQLAYARHGLYSYTRERHEGAEWKQAFPDLRFSFADTQMVYTHEGSYRWHIYDNAPDGPITLQVMEI